MKAKEYFDAYGEKIYKELITNEYTSLDDLRILMLDDLSVLLEKRNAKTNDAIRAIVNELNQKWNSLATMFEKKYLRTVLKRDGFKEYCISVNLYPASSNFIYDRNRYIPLKKETI